MSKIRPADALAALISGVYVHCYSKAPGAVIAKATPAQRDALQRLTSDDAATLRVDIQPQGGRKR